METTNWTIWKLWNWFLPLLLKFYFCFSFRTKLMKSDGKTSFRVSVNLKTVSRSGNGNAALVFTLFLFLYLTRYYFCYFFLSTWGGKIFNPKIGTYLHFALLNPELSHQAWGLNHRPLDLKASVLTIDYAASPQKNNFPFLTSGFCIFNPLINAIPSSFAILSVGFLEIE